MRLTLLRLGRAATLASAIIAASGLLEITGMPLFAAVGDVALNLAAARSEAEKLRYQIAVRMIADRSKRPQQVARRSLPARA
jgi:hypothetical protein